MQTVFRLLVILLVMESTEKCESSYYSLSYWNRLPSYSPCYSYGKVSCTTDCNKMLLMQYFSSNSKNLKKAIVQLCNGLTVCKFCYVVVDPKVGEQNILTKRL